MFKLSLIEVRVPLTTILMRKRQSWIFQKCCLRINNLTLQHENKWEGYSSSSTHFQPLIRSQVSVVAGSVECPSHQPHSPASPGGSQGVPRVDEIHNLCSMFWVCPVGSSQLDVPGKTSSGRCPRWHPDKMPEPPQLIPFDVKQQQQLWSCSKSLTLFYIDSVTDLHKRMHTK